MPRKSFIVISVFILLILVFRLSSYYQEKPLYEDNQSAQFTVLLREEPEVFGGKQSFALNLSDGTRVKVITGASPLYHYGDQLFIDGIFTKKEYDDFSLLFIYFPKVQTIDSDKNKITEFALYLRNKAKNIFESALSPVQASLLLGMIFGGKEGMPEDFYDELRVTGVLHVIAASGANVSFVAGALLAVLGRVFRRQMALIIGMCGIAFYAIVAGLEPSIVRAAIMGVIAFSASLLGRQYLALWGAYVAASLMLFVSPFLFVDIGFQLSFLATLGIVLIKPILPLGKNMFLADDVGTTLAAQLATLPLLFGVFGEFGLLSLLVNPLVLWTIPVVMTIGSIGLVIGLFVPSLGKLILFLCLPFLSFFEHVVSFFGRNGWIITIDSFPMAMGVGYYLLLFAIILYLRSRGSRNKVKEITIQMS